MDLTPLLQVDLDHAPAWLRTVDLRPDRSRGAHARSVIVRDGRELVAAGAIWTSRAHDSRYGFDVVVHPELRRRGIGRFVVKELGLLRHTDLPFVARGYVGSNRLAFVRALGARTIQVVPPARVAAQNGTRLRPYPTVRGAAEVEWATLLAANAEMYRWTHARWSPVADGFETALSEGLPDVLDVEASSVALVDGAVAALCLVYRDAMPWVLTSETVNRHVPEGERLVEGCLHRSLRVLAARGMDEVELDGHVSDPHLLPAWTCLAPRGRWFHVCELEAPARAAR